MLRNVSLTRTREELRDRLAEYAEQGVTELGFQPGSASEHGPGR
jgi:hypothetical protein